MIEYIVVIENKLRSGVMDKNKARKTRKHFLSKLNANIMVQKFEFSMLFMPIYDTLDLWELGLIG